MGCRYYRPCYPYPPSVYMDDLTEAQYQELEAKLKEEWTFNIEKDIYG